MNGSKASALVLSLGVLAMAGPAARADKAGMDIVRKMVTKYETLDTYSDSWSHTVEQGKQRQTVTGDVRIDKPNRFYLSADVNGQKNMVFAGNGKTNTLYLALQKQYAQMPAKGDMPQELKGSEHAVVSIIAGNDLMDRVSDATVSGKTTVNGVPVQIVKMVFKIPAPPKGVTLTEEQKKDLENLKKNPPDIRYYVGVNDSLMYRNEFNADGKTKDGKSVKVTIRQDFRNVRVNQPIPTTAFAFTPPSGTAKVGAAAPKK